jgi:chromosomal replication initiation ATPase DnaA
MTGPKSPGVRILVTKTPTPAEVIHAVALWYDMPEEQILGPSRGGWQVAARQLAFDAMHELYPQASHSELGRWMGRSHEAAAKALGRSDPGALRAFLFYLAHSRAGERA